MRGEGPGDLEALALALTARMVLLGGLAKSLPEADAMARAALQSGQGVERLRRMIAEQGGDPRVVDDPALLPTAPKQMLLRAGRTGYVGDIDAELVGRAAMLLGAGRDRMEDAIDPAVGVRILAKPGEAIQAGEPFVEIHYGGDGRLPDAVALLNQGWRIDDTRPTETTLIVESIS